MKVVNIRFDAYTHFIGRPTIYGNYAGIARSGRTGPSVVRTNNLIAFESAARSSPVILEAIRALPPDATLGCFCAPLPCHGDIIVKLWQEMHPEASHASLTPLAVTEQDSGSD